jgi:hypothetical protein
MTDDDQAFYQATSAAFDEIFQDNRNAIHHALCANHKRDNIINKSRELGLSKEQKQLVKKLTQTICFSRNIRAADQAFESLLLINGDLRNYLERNIVGDLPKFARSYLSDIHCLDYNTTSVAESMNHLLKHTIPNRKMTLTDLRKHACFKLNEYEANIDIMNQNQRIIRTDFEIENQILLSKRICDDLILEIRKSENFTAMLCEDDRNDMDTENTEKWKVFNVKGKQNPKYYLANSIWCECGSVEFQGIPCCHIITVCTIKSEAFPIALISPRWILESNPDIDYSIV